MEATFGPFTFDDARRQVRQGAQLVSLSPKAFELLGVLLQHRPNALSKAELHRALWPETFVSDGSLAVLIAEIRRALGDSVRQPTYIRTVHRFGYAFDGNPARAGEAHDDRVPASRWWLAWGRRNRVRLHHGPNVIGRDPGADVCIDAIGVSRRHVRLVLDAAGVTVEDLSSKNGTFVNDVRVSSPVRLTSAAEVRLGALSTRIHPTGRETSTQTISRTSLHRGPA